MPHLLTVGRKQTSGQYS